MHVRRLASFVMLVFLYASSGSAFAAEPSGSIVALSAQNPAPVPGDVLTFATGVTSKEAWPAGSYTVRIEVRDQNGAELYQADGSGEATTPGQTSVVFAQVHLAQGAAGTYSATALLEKDGAVIDRSQAQTFVVSVQVAQLQNVPPPPAAAASLFTLDGNVTTNANFSGGQISQNGTLNFDGKTSEGASFQTSGGLSNTPGASKPVFTYNTATSIVELGTFAPSYDPLAFDGVTGEGIAFKHAYGETHELRLATVVSARGTLNPFTVEALSYVLPVSGTTSKITATLGHVNVTGPVPGFETLPFVDHGDFGALSLVKADPASPFGYTLRFSTISYVDKASLERHNGQAFDVQAHTTMGKAAWNLDVLRASAFFPTLTAPSVTADRQTETLGLSLPLGVISASLNLNGYSDNLSGANLPQTTHYWTQSLALNAPLRNGDQLGINLSGGSQHQAANQILFPSATDTASANDATSIQYGGRRGEFNFQGSLGYNNQHDLLGNLQHSTQDNITLGRAVSKGLSVTGTLNLTTNVSAAAESTNSVFGKALNLSYTSGPFTYQGGVTQSRTHPYLGLRPPDTSSETFGWTYALGRNFQFQFNLSSNTSGPSQSTQGALNVTQRF